MRDPMSWSLPLFRAFDITVRLHILYILITLGLVLRVVVQNPDAWVDFVILFVVMLFVAVLLHEYGHCFAARSVDGDANDILIWPLGGLAYCEVPPNARANFITAAAGPAVTLGLAVGCAVVLFAGSYVPSVNPVNGPYKIVLSNWRSGQDAVHPDYAVWVDAKTGERVGGEVVMTEGGPREIRRDGRDKTLVPVNRAALEPMPLWVLWVARFFWLNWFLFLINLIPGFPLDGGRMLQAVIWGRTEDYRRATTIAIYAGYAAAILMVLVAIMTGELLVFFLALFIYISCRQFQFNLETGLEESPFGDFSQGYTSLERDEDRPRKPRRPNFIRRWLLRRAARRLQREHEQRVTEERRMDELLEKISRTGKGSLTDEERRFLDRVSARYRKRPQEEPGGSENW